MTLSIGPFFWVPTLSAILTTGLFPKVAGKNGAVGIPNGLP